MLRFPGACVLPVPGRCCCTNSSKDERAGVGRVEFVAWRENSVGRNLSVTPNRGPVNALLSLAYSLLEG